MATFTAIKNTTQSGGAMRGSLNYIKRKDKTLWGDRQLVSGWNCVAQSAYDEMMTTKRRHGKTGGRMFYQFVQSFSPEEKVAPEEVHIIGLELAQCLFPDFEVVVATHVDTDHLHNHLIVNSVSWKDGKKLHQNAADLQRQRLVSDEICAAHGLTVLAPPNKRTQDKQMRPGEYRSAVRGESWKFQLINTVDLCMRVAPTKKKFVEEMEKRGYQVRWEEKRKAITYTTPTGMKCRDDRLHDNKYKKEVMEREFRIREEIIRRRAEAEELAVGADTNGGLPHAGAVGGTAGVIGKPVPCHGSAIQPHSGTGQDDANRLLHAEFHGSADRKAGEVNCRDDRSTPTGWEQERAEAFSAPPDQPSQTHAGMALGHPGLGGVGDSLVRLGHALERDQSPSPTAPMTGHGDRKALAKERRKKIAQGHRPDDREEQQIMNLN